MYVFLGLSCYCYDSMLFLWMYRMNGGISLVMYHGGRSVRNGRGNREYTWKGQRVWEDIDLDLVCIFDIERTVVECGNYGNV